MQHWPRPLVEDSEERIFYSADFAPALIGAERFEAVVAQPASPELAPETRRSEIVVIDAEVAAAEQLAADLERQRAAGRAIEIVRIGADEDGIARIGEALRGRHDIGAVHIISHGAEGSLRLGAATLDAATLLARAQDIAAWSAALSSDSDLLIYGCDVAAGAQGRALAEGLAALTGADVAASDDPTGAVAAGGDWTLELEIGAVESALAPSAIAQQAWQGVLGTAAGPGSTGTAIFADNGQSRPQSAYWDGMSFGSVSSSASIGELRNLQAAEAPTRDEMIVVGVTASGSIRGERWDGSAATWNTLTFNASVSEPDRIGFAVAYEQASGDALVVWNDDSEAPGAKLRYAIWDGASWSAPAAIGAYGGAEPQHMQLAARPGSNEMVLVVNDANSDDFALVWNGTAWGNAVSLDASGSGEDDQSALAVAYETVSGQAMVAYGKDGDTELYYRHWNGAAWSAEGAAGLPAAVLSQLNWLTLASDPNSDRIAAGALRSDLLGSTAGFAVWDGSGWAAPVSTSSLFTSATDRSLAVAFEADGGNALAVYEGGDNAVRYRTWTAAGGWSAQVSGPNIGANPNTLELVADPYTDHIMLATVDSARDINFVRWDGDAWGTSAQLTSDSGENGNRPFAFVWQQTAPVTGTSVWLSPKSDATAPGWPGVNAVYQSEVLQFGQPGLNFSPATTAGTFRHVFDLREFALDGTVDLDAVHYVSRTVNLPGLTLQAGDVLFSTESNETLSANNTLAVLDSEIVLFRPDTAGDYRAGTFSILLDNFGSLHGGSDTTALALVEQDTVFGEVTLTAGTFLFARDGGSEENDVYRFVATGVGAGSTAGAVSVVLRGSDISLNSKINGLHLVSAITTVGNVNLPSGALLITLDADDNNIGASNLDVEDEDVFYLTVAQTSLSGTAQVSAAMFLHGDDVGAGGERFDSLALHSSNNAPVLDATGSPSLGAVAEDAVNPAGTTVAALLASGAGGDPISDADPADPEGIAVIGLDTGNGTWQFSTTSGASWTAFGAVSGTSATLLDTAALIRFVPNANYNGAVTLQFRAWDGYGGANGQRGVDVSDNGGGSAFLTALESATLTVTSINDNPVLALNAGMTVNQGASVVIGPTRLASSDADHAASQLTYELTALPAFGTLELNGVALILGGTFTQADVDAGRVSYAHDGSVNPADSFSFDVYDAAAGAAAGPSTFNLAITTSNAAPVITANALTVAEGARALPNLAATDADNAPAQLAYTVSGVSGGHFELTTNPGVAITTFTQAQVDAALVEFVHDGGEAAPAYDVSLSDGAAGVGPVAAAITFSNVNDAPTIVAAGLTVLESGTAAPLLAATDSDSAPAALVYTVSGLAYGRFELVAAPGVAITSFTQAQINAGDVVFVHDGGEEAPLFQVSVSDAILGAGPQAASISFTEIADAPLIAANAIVLSEGQTLVLDATHVTAIDPDSTPAQLLWSVSGVSNGRFEYVASPGAAIGSFTQAEIEAGLVQFVHDGSEAAPAYTLALSDGTSATAPQAGAVTFTSVNDAPVIAFNTLTLVEGASVVLSNAQIAATDPDHGPGQLLWSVSGLSGGRFEYVATPGSAIASFTQAEIDAGAVRFVHDGGEAAPAYALTLGDAGASVGPAAAAVSFTRQDDAPVLALNTGATLDPGASIVIGAGMLHGADVDSAPAALAYTLLASPAHGTLLLAGRALGAGEQFTQAEVDAGLLSYLNAGTGAAADSFGFRLADSSSTLAAASFDFSVNAPPAVPVPPPVDPVPPPVDPAPPPVDPAPPPVDPAPPAADPAPPTVDPAPPVETPTPKPRTEEIVVAAPEQRVEPAPVDSAPRTDAAKPREAPAAPAEPSVHAIAPAAPERFSNTDEAAVRSLAGLDEGPRNAAAATNAVSAVQWIGRASAAVTAPLALPSLIGEAQAMATSGVIDVHFRAGQPPREALLELDQVRGQIEEQLAQSRSVVASTIAVSTGLSVGYVLWLVRGGLLLSSVLSALPAWQVVDPLPVLGNLERDGEDSDEDDDAVERLFRRSGATPRPRSAAAAAPGQHLPAEVEA